MHSFTKFAVLTFLSIGAVSAVHADPPPAGWDGRGTVDHYFVADANVYAYTPTALVYLTDLTCFGYPINSTDISKTWTGEVLEARANGQELIIMGTGATLSNGCKYVKDIWINH